MFQLGTMKTSFLVVMRCAPQVVCRATMLKWLLLGVWVFPLYHVLKCWQPFVLAEHLLGSVVRTEKRRQLL